jgi:hypothetical protein
VGPSIGLAQHGWTTPRTPWGDPDLQGHYSNKYETSTPFERPKEFEGRRIGDVKPDELAAAVKRRQADTLERAKFFGGDPEGKIGNSAEFRDIYEITKGSRPWFVTDPPDGLIPALVPEARARIAAQPRTGSFGSGPFNSHLDFSLWERCITRGLPGSMLPGQYGNSYEIVQAPGLVAIRYEMIHETRVIPLDDHPHVGPAIREYLGDARGHWEGNSLVVETTNFTDRTHFGYNNRYNSQTFTLTERFTPVGPNTLQWQVTFNDPEVWTRPFTFAMPLTRDNSQPVFEYACHEGNLGLEHILSAARAEERQ